MSESETYLWHIWPARHWPLSAEEELGLVSSLESVAKLAAGKILQHERGDLTTVLNVVRNGMGLEELLKVAPGVVPKRLLSAYRHIDKLRQRSLHSFAELLADPTPHTVHLHAQEASQLLPVPTYRLVAAVSDPALSLSSTVAEVRATIASVVSAAAEYERRLASSPLTDLEAVRLGRVLYDPFAGGVWSHPYYTPLRVGTLVPTRVRDLLGEREE